MSNDNRHFNPTNQKFFDQLNNPPDTSHLDNQYPTNEWATFQQWKKVGRYVKRHQKGTKLTASTTGFSWYVFNIEQTEQKTKVEA